MRTTLRVHAYLNFLLTIFDPPDTITNKSQPYPDPTAHRYLFHGEVTDCRLGM